MTDESGVNYLQPSRRRVLRMVSGLTALGVSSVVTSSSVTADHGDQQWGFETGGDVRSSPTVVDGTVFVGSFDSNLYAVDAETGEEEWVFETDGGIYSSPTVVDGTVFVGSGDNNLYAVDSETGIEQWAFETDWFARSSPTVVDGTIFVGSFDYNLYAVDAETGEEEWVFETDGYVLSSPTVVDGTIFVGSDDNNLYAVDAGVPDSSEGSRTRLGTLGHHGDWAYADQRISGEENRDTFLIEPVNPTIKAGSTTEIEVEVTNKLNEPATDIEGKLFADDPLDSANDEVFIESLDAGETTTVTVDLSASESATAKNYRVSMDFRYTDDNGDIKLTDSYETVITVESSSVQAPSSGIIESNQTMIVVGGGGIIGASLYAWQRSRGSDDDTVSTESSIVETDATSQATANSTNEDGTATADELQEQAIEAIDRAEKAAEDSDHELVIKSYKKALNNLEKATAEAADSGVEKELETTYAETQAALDSVTTRRERRDSIATTLQAAEQSFKEAIARYAATEQTVARIRFRQARDAFEEAQQAIDDSDAEVLAQPVEVSFEEDATLPSMALEDLAVLVESTVETLAAVDIESITDMESDPDDKKITPPVVSDLKESDEVSSEETALLTILSWWYERARREFGSEAELSQRYEQADYGFNQST